jgi:predicted AAA+ superfamily ATPase
MALTDDLIARQNVWWTDPAGWESTDAHLRRLAAQPISLPSMTADVIPLDRPGLHTLRGARQVGKSTDLKLLARRALLTGFAPRNVLYFSFEPLIGQHVAAAIEAITKARQLAGRGGPSLVLLDEVTAVANWQAGIMHLYEIGVIDQDIVVCTGSSAVDLRKGGHERLPGRRGSGWDHLVSPRDFATFSSAIDPQLPTSPHMSPGDIATEDGWHVLQDVRIHSAALERCLNLYAQFGGLPAAVAEAATGSLTPSPSVRRIVYDSLVGEALRKGASEDAVQALLERILRSLSSKVSWRTLAAEMDVPLGTTARARAASPSAATVRDYVSTFADAYFLLVVYFWKPDNETNALSKDKKIYLADPLLHTVALERAPGLSGDPAHLVENMVAMALYRRCEPIERQTESQGGPSALHVYGTRAGGEIDFVCGSRSHAVPVEVKYQARPDLRKAAAMPRAFPERPAIVVTRDTLERRSSYLLVPASLFLWALG